MPRSLSFVLLLLGSGCADGVQPVPVAAGPYWAPIDDFFDGAIGWEKVTERPDRPIKMRVLSPLPFLDPEGYDLPLLEMAPPAEVRLAPPTGSGPLRFEAFTGAVERVGREDACRVRFEVWVAGRSVLSVEREWGPEQTTGERQWEALAPVEVPDGADLVLRTTLVEGSAETPLEVGFGRPRILRETPRSTPIAETPNIVFVLMDTLRRDKLSVYGGDADRTPHLARLAERGTVFDDAYATASWTWPSTASILTGLLPEEHGITHHDESYLHGRVQTLPELLREAGYVTGGFSTNPLIDVCHNYDQGFDTFDDPTWLFDPTSAVADGVLRWLREHSEQRFFLYLHLVDPHVPYEPLPRFADDRPDSKALERPRLPMELRDHLIEQMAAADEAGTSFVPGAHVNVSVVRALESQYERCVQSADYWIGEFLDELDDLDLLDDTVFVFTSDHGEEFLEHGLLAHASSLHRELTNVPLLVAGPGWKAGQRVPRAVSNRHLAPTLLRLAGGDPTRLGGSDRIDLRQTAALPERPVFFSTTTGIWRGRKATPVYGMRAADWLVHVWETPADRGGGWDTRIFDLVADPGALVDLAADDPVRATTLQEVVLERLGRSREHFEAQGDIDAVGAGEAGMQLLRSIGYIGEDE